MTITGRMGRRIAWHEEEMAADRVVYSAEQRAVECLCSSIRSLDPASYLDFLPAPTPEEMRANAIRHARMAIDILTDRE